MRITKLQDQQANRNIHNLLLKITLFFSQLNDLDERMPGKHCKTNSRWITGQFDILRSNFTLSAKKLHGLR